MIAIYIIICIAFAFVCVIVKHDAEAKYAKKYNQEALKFQKRLEDIKKTFYNKGYKDGLNKGQHQGFEDGQRYAEAVRHNEEEFKKEGLLP